MDRFNVWVVGMVEALRYGSEMGDERKGREAQLAVLNHFQQIYRFS